MQVSSFWNGRFLILNHKRQAVRKKGTASFLISTNIGNVNPIGTVNSKVGDVVTLTYSGNNDYYFPGWVVISTAIDEVLTREQTNQFFECEDWSKNVIDVRIKKESSNFTVAANSYLRPHVFSHEPLNSDDGVTQDTNVKIYFDSVIDEKSLYFTADEEFKIKQQDPGARFESDENGKYAYTSSSGEFYYKNLTIENRATGENLSKYYAKPYLLEDKKTMILPANKVRQGNGLLDEAKLPPGGIQIFIQLGTAYGFYADDNLIPLGRDTNLTWIYSTRNGVDAHVPSISSYTVDGTNNLGAFSAKSKTTKPANKTAWQGCYLKDNMLTVSAEFRDDSKNLFDVYLRYTRIQDENLNDVNEAEKKYPLSFEKNSTIFTVKSKTLNFREITEKDGTYAVSLVGMDDAKVMYKCKKNGVEYILEGSASPEVPLYSKIGDFTSKRFAGNSKNSITLEVGLPESEDGFSKIEVICKKRDGSSETFESEGPFVPGQKNNIEVTDLEPETYYECVVYVEDKHGNSLSLGSYAAIKAFTAPELKTGEAHIGQIYYDDDTWSSVYIAGKTPVGIVLAVNDSGKPTRIFSFQYMFNSYKYSDRPSTSSYDFGSGNKFNSGWQGPYAADLKPLANNDYAHKSVAAIATIPGYETNKIGSYGCACHVGSSNIEIVSGYVKTTYSGEPYSVIHIRDITY